MSRNSQVLLYQPCDQEMPPTQIRSSKYQKQLEVTHSYPTCPPPLEVFSVAAFAAGAPPWVTPGPLLLFFNPQLLQTSSGRLRQEADGEGERVCELHLSVT